MIIKTYARRMTMCLLREDVLSLRQQAEVGRKKGDPPAGAPPSINVGSLWLLKTCMLSAFA